MSASAKNTLAWSESDYPIPEEVLTRDGLKIRTSDRQWRVELNSSLNWELASALPKRLLYPVRAYLCHALESKSGATAQVAFTRLVRGLSTIDARRLSAMIEDGIGADLFVAVKSSMENDPNLGTSTVLDTLSEFRRWYIWCADCELPGFDEEAALALVDKVIGGSPKGRMVLQGDPDIGPLSFVEDTRLEAAISQANGIVQVGSTRVLQALVAVMLSKSFGLYGKHLQLLNEDDYRIERLSDGSEIHWLNVPRLKKRGGRAEVGSRKRRLTPRAGRCIQSLIERNAINVERGATIARVSSHRPLFVRVSGRDELVGTALERDAYRWSRSEFLNAMNNFREAYGLEMRLSPRRLRYSFATRLVDEGCSPAELADALDHTDLQHVMVYFNARGRVVRQLDEGMAIRLAPFAMAFLGRPIDGPHQATRANDPASVIRFGTPNGDQADVGNCGSLSQCGLNAPLACYTCRRFEPWADAPHDIVLAVLVEERKRRKVAGFDEKLVQIHDTTILAVADVVRRCKTTGDSERGASS